MAAFLCFHLAMYASSCARKVHTDTHTESRDSTEVKIIAVDKVKGLGLSIGQSIEIPELGLDITRFSDKEVLVSYPVRVDREVRTTVVSTRTKIKDSYNVSDVDKSKVKDVDKSKVKEVTTTKTKTGSGLPWYTWLLLVPALLLALAFKYRKYILTLFWPLR